MSGTDWNCIVDLTNKLHELYQQCKIILQAVKLICGNIVAVPSAIITLKYKCFTYKLTVTVHTYIHTAIENNN